MWIGPKDHKIVGAFLAKVRQDANVTQVELARRLSKPQSFVSSYERGQRRIDFLEFAQVILTLGGDPNQVGALLLKVATTHVRDKGR